MGYGQGTALLQSDSVNRTQDHLFKRMTLGGNIKEPLSASLCPLASLCSAVILTAGLALIIPLWAIRSEVTQLAQADILTLPAVVAALQGDISRGLW